jgi:murein DD-endopeptidase MepM/ murein hydrolase activator NlpD
MKFPRILASISFPALLVACGGQQEPAPVEYRNTAPASAPAAAPAPLVRSNAPDARGVIVYPDYAVVQARSGDTIDAMAGRAGVAPSELAAYNGLPTNYTPQPGDELVLPPRPGGYQVAAAAPLAGPISGPISTPASEPAPNAGAGWNPAAIGSVIGDDATETATITPFEQGPAPQRGFDVAGQSVVSHQVAPGETIYSISRQYDVAAETLIEWNNLVGPSYTVYPGQILSVPATGSLAPLADAPATRFGSAISPADQSLTTLPAPRSAAPVDTVAATPLQSPQLGQYQSAPTEEVASAAPAPAPATAASAATGRLAPPVSGQIIRRYNKTSGAARNDGVDFAAREGEDVRAADNGTVALVSRSLGGLGNIILIRHNSEILTVYGRVGEIKVAKGAKVRRGQPIAVVAPGNSLDGPTVHFEVRRGAVSVDPEEYL